MPRAQWAQKLVNPSGGRPGVHTSHLIIVGVVQILVIVVCGLAFLHLVPDGPLARGCMAVIHRVICVARGPNIRPGGKASGTAGDPGTSVYPGDPVPLFFPPRSSMTAALLTCLGKKTPEDPGSNALGMLHSQTLLVCSLRGRPLWTYSAGVPTHHPTSSSWRDSSGHQSSSELRPPEYPASCFSQPADHLPHPAPRDALCAHAAAALGCCR